VAKRYGQFPIVLETYRECLRDVLDLPALDEVLRALHRRELTLVEVETQRASPFASSLLFDYVATYMYEGDTPNAERRAAALSLDRDLLRELLGQEELRELLDPAALEEVEADLQRTSDRARAANTDGLHDILRAVGDLSVAEAQARCLDAVSAKRMLGELVRERRAVAMRIGGEERFLPAEDAGLYRDAFGAVPPGGLPESFLTTVEEPLARITRRYARTHGPFTTAELRDRYGVDPSPVLRELERSGALVRGELRPGGTEREWCDADVLRRLRRASLASLRREVEPAERGRGWTRGPRAGPAWTVCGRCSCRCRASPWRPRCGSVTCFLGARARTRPPGSTRCARPGSSCGLERARSDARRGASPCSSVRTPGGSGRRRARASPLRRRCITRCVSDSRTARASLRTSSRT
jgi:ATP-dependent Lhr-like helicase